MQRRVIAQNNEVVSVAMHHRTVEGDFGRKKSIKRGLNHTLRTPSKIPLRFTPALDFLVAFKDYVVKGSLKDGMRFHRDSEPFMLTTNAML